MTTDNLQQQVMRLDAWLSDESHWTKGALGRNASGIKTSCRIASSTCLLGAATRIAGYDDPFFWLRKSKSSPLFQLLYQTVKNKHASLRVLTFLNPVAGQDAEQYVVPKEFTSIENTIKQNTIASYNDSPRTNFAMIREIIDEMKREVGLLETETPLCTEERILEDA